MLASILTPPPPAADPGISAGVAVLPQTPTGAAQLAAVADAGGVIVSTSGAAAPTVGPAASSDSVADFLRSLGNDVSQAGDTYARIRQAINGGGDTIPSGQTAPPGAGSVPPARSPWEWAAIGAGLLALAWIVTRR